MRCLVVADLHYSLPQFDWLLSAAPNFDLVIFAGDALDIGSAVDFRAQIVVVKKYLSLLSGCMSGYVNGAAFSADGCWFDGLGDPWSFNPGMQPGRPPVYIVLYIDDGTAFWLAAGEAQTIDLKAPLRRPAAPVITPPA